jgi:hypothetical protein
MSMNAKGSFEIDLEPQTDSTAPMGRMLISKTYEGNIEAQGSGQMLSKRTDNGVAVYCAIEEVVGSVDGKTGAFTLLHNGYMSSERQSLEIQIVEGTGTGELTNIQGTLEIIQSETGHSYELNYSL